MSKIAHVDTVLSNFYNNEPIDRYDIVELQEIVWFHVAPKWGSPGSKEFKWFIQCIEEFLSDRSKVSADRLNRARWSAYPFQSKVHCRYVAEKYRRG